MEARSQYLQAAEFGLARDVTDRLSSFFVMSGFYDYLRELNVALLNYELHPAPINWIARTYIEQGEYDSARIWYQKSIDASAVSNQKELGLAWHGLARIDFSNGDYYAVRERLWKAMKIRKKIGGQAAEAATIHQIGFLAWEFGRSQEGLRLVVLAYLMLSDMGNANAKRGFEVLIEMASKLNYTQQQLDVLQQEVAEAYRKDRGQGLIEAAFPRG